jgi:hypothetical protein
MLPAGRQPSLAANRRNGHWADRRLFVKRTHLILPTEQRGQGEGDFLTRSEGEMQMAVVAARAAAFRRYRELHAEHPDRAPAPRAHPAVESFLTTIRTDRQLEGHH